MTTNEAAERLLSDPSILLMFSGPEIIGLNEGELELHLEAVATAERRATVERIRERMHRDECSPPCLSLVKGDAILDEEAARG